jgi:DNA-binding GntR family transcriptional regulator
VLAHLLGDLISRCALITLMYQTTVAAVHSHDEHQAIVQALADKDEALALRLMDQHLLHVEASLAFDRKTPHNDLAMALA